MKWKFLALMCLIIFYSSCDIFDSDGEIDQNDYLPLIEGNSWTYDYQRRRIETFGESRMFISGTLSVNIDAHFDTDTSSIYEADATFNGFRTERDVDFQLVDSSEISLTYPFEFEQFSNSSIRTSTAKTDQIGWRFLDSIGDGEVEFISDGELNFDDFRRFKSARFDSTLRYLIAAGISYEVEAALGVTNYENFFGGNTFDSTGTTLINSQVQ